MLLDTTCICIRTRIFVWQILLVMYICYVCMWEWLCVHVRTMGIVLLRLYFDIWFMLVWNHFHASHYAIYESERVVFTVHRDLLPAYQVAPLRKFHYSIDSGCCSDHKVKVSLANEGGGWSWVLMGCGIVVMMLLWNILKNIGAFFWQKLK